MFSKIFIKGWRVETTWTLYLDYAKAFDKVSYKLLLAKFQKFGIRGDLLCWFENYLSGRLVYYLEDGLK